MIETHLNGLQTPWNSLSDSWGAFLEAKNLIYLVSGANCIMPNHAGQSEFTLSVKYQEQFHYYYLVFCQRNRLQEVQGGPTQYCEKVFKQQN